MSDFKVVREDRRNVRRAKSSSSHSDSSKNKRTSANKHHHRHSDLHSLRDAAVNVTQQRLTYRVGLYAQGKQSTTITRANNDLPRLAENDARARADLHRLLEMANSRKRKASSTISSEEALDSGGREDSFVNSPASLLSPARLTRRAAIKTPPKISHRSHRRTKAVADLSPSPLPAAMMAGGGDRLHRSPLNKLACPKAPSRLRPADIQPKFNSSDVRDPTAQTSSFPSLHDLLLSTSLDFKDSVRAEISRRAPKDSASQFEQVCANLTKIRLQRSPQPKTSPARTLLQEYDVIACSNTPPPDFRQQPALVSSTGVQVPTAFATCYQTRPHSTTSASGMPQAASSIGVAADAGPLPESTTQRPPSQPQPRTVSFRGACAEERRPASFSFAGLPPFVNAQSQYQVPHNDMLSERPLQMAAPSHQSQPRFTFPEPEVTFQRHSSQPQSSSGSGSAFYASQTPVGRQMSYLYPVPVRNEYERSGYQRSVASAERNRELLARLQNPSDTGAFSALDHLTAPSSQMIMGYSPCLGPTATTTLVHDESSDSPLWRPLFLRSSTSPAVPPLPPPSRRPSPRLYRYRQF